jgi:hypothetical protein
VAEVARRPWTKLMADDIFVALLTSRFRMEEIHVNADYDFHGTYTKVKKERKKERKKELCTYTTSIRPAIL